MICQNCNTQMTDDAKFCPACGTPTGIREVPFQAPNNPATETPYNVAPAFTQNTTTPLAPAKKKFWKTGKASGLSKFFIILLAIVLFFTSFITIFLCNARSAISESSIESSFEDISFDELIENLDAEDALEEFKYKMRNRFYHATVTDDSIENVLERSTIKAFVAEKIKDFVEGVLENKYAKLSISYNEVYELLVENKDILSDEFSMHLDYNDIHYITNIIMSNLNDGDLISEDIDDDDAEELLDISEFFLSSSIFIVLLIITLLIIFGMISINLPKGLSATAIIFIIVSTIYLLIDLVFVTLILPALIKEAPDFLSVVINGFFTPSTIISIVMLVLGIAALVVLKIIKVKSKKAKANTYQQNNY